MCEANAYIIENNEQKMVLESVDTLEPFENGVKLTSIFGEQKFLDAYVHSLSLVEHKIFLKNIKDV
ncbi:MAG: CooT family nickel-binding protein [Deltaproteobacteria bacterium]|nr:CooT family nickel-binding protein [Deltaproteobacteria bacterium]